MERRRFLKMALCLPFMGMYPASPMSSQDVPRFDTRTILLLKTRVAGLRFHGGERVRTLISAGDPVVLRREPSNPHDARAVAIFWKNEKLGYLPRSDNSVIAGLLDQGAPVDAHIVRMHEAEEAWGKLEVKVELHG
jgi:hypothetical protein